MPGLLPNIDPDGLLEYSVVFTDRSLNHMSARFRDVMKDISATLKEVYAADSVAVVPGGGTYAMEAVARQFGTGKRCLVLRNGWFSYRWTQIFEAGGIPAESTVLKARPAAGPAGGGDASAFAPAPIDELVAAIESGRPDAIFAPHVETSSGIILPDDYARAVADVARGVGALFVLDAIASGAMWVDMRELGVDVLLSAPQKGWSGSPCAGLVMLGERALGRMDPAANTSFSCDLLRWLDVMRSYEAGGHTYHTTMPTDALRMFHDSMTETRAFGFERARTRQLELGDGVRALLAERGFRSVAAPGFGAPGVVVSYTSDAAIQNGSAFAAAGLQIAAGVPLRCGEPSPFRTFRLGLFGLDKLDNVGRTVSILSEALDRVAPQPVGPGSSRA
ncbi:MAG: alanine--glyoxylate aminotransferase family protein [Gemmatimonadetes bacterium]|nr:alanine--glyoxylate aminotransferase family protein [Gemmatimonadota bacterium]MYE69774.1 alanine--glyoxylate aminotransferase family protein [Gemmatimonadota bacterium]MYJ69023.1 alanine--glyoxylate aminotransferase family protein [Gemmatimonadota bacterium]